MLKVLEVQPQTADDRLFIRAGTVVTVQRILNPKTAGRTARTLLGEATRHRTSRHVMVTNAACPVCDPLDPARSHAQACWRVDYKGYRVFFYAADTATETVLDEEFQERERAAAEYRKSADYYHDCCAGNPCDRDN